MSSLFRRDALDANRPQWLGDILVLQPPSAQLMSILTVCALTALMALLWFGEYTRRTTVSGKLAPAAGLVQLYSNQAGTVLERKFAEGDLVKAGQVMYVISGERRSGAEADTQLSISREMMGRRDSVERELSAKRLTLRDQERRTRKAIDRLRAELTQADHQISDQLQRVALESATSKRYLDLFEKGYVSGELLKEKQGGMLEQNSRLATFQRERLTIQRAIGEKEDGLAEQSARFASESGALQRELSQFRQDWSANELRRSEVIVAPMSGIATASAIDAGQVVTAGIPLASIVPQGSRMLARLYAPSNAVGFIAPGDPVRLRYEAFPYQRFGLAHGRVKSISQAPLQPQDSIINTTPAPAGAHYEIIVELEQQTILVNGRQRRLPAGMLLEADVLSETRRLYQWMFVPFQELNAMRG